MKRWLLFCLTFILAACSTGQAAEMVPEVQSTGLPDLGAAPELTNEVWLNTERPLRIADLQGRVVLLEMWTFG